MNSTFVTVAVIGLLAVMSPGPDFLIVSRNSLLYSKRVGLATALGIAVGNIWWIAASVLGIALVVSRTVFLFNAIKWLGAIYLVYLGIRGVCARKKADSSEEVAETKDGAKGSLSLGAAFRMGLLTNVLNPKCAMFFLSFFSVVITPKTSTVLQWAYGLEIMVIAICWFSLLATVLSVEKVRGVFKRFSLWLDRTTGAVLILLGIKVALYRKG